MKKLTVITITLLFVGFALAPSINANAAESERFVNLEGFTNKIKSNLVKVCSRKEARLILDDALVKLFQMKLISKPTLNDLRLILNDNRYSLIVGKTTNTQYHSRIGLIKILQLLKEDVEYWEEQSLRCDMIFLYTTIYNSILPISKGKTISFGYQQKPMTIGAPTTESASGWIFTFGYNRKQSWEGDMIGNCNSYYTYYLLNREFFIGAEGFNGLKITYKVSEYQTESFYLGSANKVDIDYAN